MKAGVDKKTSPGSWAEALKPSAWEPLTELTHPVGEHVSVRHPVWRVRAVQRLSARFTKASLKSWASTLLLLVVMGGTLHGAWRQLIPRLTRQVRAEQLQGMLRGIRSRQETFYHRTDRFAGSDEALRLRSDPELEATTVLRLPRIDGQDFLAELCQKGTCLVIDAGGRVRRSEVIGGQPIGAVAKLSSAGEQSAPSGPPVVSPLKAGPPSGILTARGRHAATPIRAESTPEGKTAGAPVERGQAADGIPESARQQAEGRP